MHVFMIQQKYPNEMIKVMTFLTVFTKQRANISPKRLIMIRLSTRPVYLYYLDYKKHARTTTVKKKLDPAKTM